MILRATAETQQNTLELLKPPIQSYPHTRDHDRTPHSSSFQTINAPLHNGAQLFCTVLSFNVAVTTTASLYSTMPRSSPTSSFYHKTLIPIAI